MTARPLFSVVVATLLRPSYAAFVESLRRQTFHDWELVARADPPNEYVARNAGASHSAGRYLVFRDDDSTLPSDHLRTLATGIRSHGFPAAVGGPLRGDMFRSGTTVLNQPKWGVGANMAVRRDAFGAVGGFETDWGLGRPVKGWRADTDLWWKLEDRFPGGVLWLDDLVVDHPGPMGSVWQPAVEDVFFRRWRARCMERFVPVDPRLQQFCLETQDLSAEETAHILKCRAAMRGSMPHLPVLPQEQP